MMKLLLFDIDGTLVLSGGAGLRAMNEAFFRLFGLEDRMLRLNLAGRTDTAILQTVMQDNGLSFSVEAQEKFKALYFQLLRKELRDHNPQKRVMPGVRELLSALCRRDHIYLGLLTGNWEQSGRLKLADLNLNRYFSFGAFADDSGIRDELLPFAVRRFSERYALHPAPEQIYVIGDTPFDIQCARPHGAIAVAVAAAQHNEKQLAAHQPDYLFPDLSDLERVLQVLG